MSCALSGKRILVVEDEFLVAAFLEDVLAEIGAVVVGPAYRIEEGESLARTEDLDAAILDVNIRGRRSDPIAEILRSRGIPYVLATGYGDAEMSSDQPILVKPYTPEKLADTLSELTNAHEKP